MSWVNVPAGSDFPVENLPYGAFSTEDGVAPRIGVAIGDHVLDLAPVLDSPVFAQPTLNSFLGEGRARWRAVRARLTELLTDSRHRAAVEPHLLPRHAVRLHLPFEVADYVDFYASEDHASNLGRMFRPEQQPLTPNWKWIPIGYHGRAGTVVISGTDIVRPCGQRKAPADPAPTAGPTRRLDIEAELGFVVGVPTRLGDTVPLERAQEHLFGVVLVNDWSARDLQSWEYVPLGPFLGKSFATSVSPWVVPLEALESARLAPPHRDPEPLPYLRGDADRGLDVRLEVRLNGQTISRPPYGRMYWTAEQMLTHMTMNGASLRTGDFFASGTISGPDPDERGSFIEMSWNGTQPLHLADGSTRTFLEDGDTVSISARAPGRGGVPIGFGEVTGTIRPARPVHGGEAAADRTPMDSAAGTGSGTAEPPPGTSSES